MNTMPRTLLAALIFCLACGSLAAADPNQKFNVGFSALTDALGWVYSATNPVPFGGVVVIDANSLAALRQAADPNCNGNLAAANATLRAGDPNLNGEAAMRQDANSVANAVRLSVTPGSSTIYNGGADANNALWYWVDANVPNTGQIISVGAFNLLDVQVGDSNAAQAITLCISEYSTSPPRNADANLAPDANAPALLRRCIEISLGPDLTRPGNKLAFGRADGAAYLKQPLRLAVSPNSFVTITTSSACGVAFCRYRPLGGL